MVENKKYRLTDNSMIHEGTEVYQIEALIDIPAQKVKIGDLGGFIESEDNLSSATEDSSWVGYGVTDDLAGVVKGKAYVGDGSTVEGGSVVYGDSSVLDSRIENRSVISHSKIESGSQINQSTIDYSTITGSDVLKADVEFSTFEQSIFKNADSTDLKMVDSSVENMNETIRGGEFENAHILNGDVIRTYSIQNSLVKGEEGVGFPRIEISSIEDSKIYGKSEIIEGSSAMNSLVVNGVLYESNALDATIKGSVGNSKVTNATVEEDVVVDTMSIFGDDVLDYKGISDELDEEYTVIEDQRDVDYFSARKDPTVVYTKEDLITFTGEEAITLTEEDLNDLDESNDLYL